jgi:nucleoid DNA-binding protein
MNRSDIEDQFCNQFDHEDAKEIFNHFIKELRQSILNGDQITFRGFGSFYTKITDQKHNVRNPRSNVVYGKSNRVYTRFKAYRSFLDQINKEDQK